MGSFYGVRCADCSKVVLLVDEEEYNAREGETALTQKEKDDVGVFLRRHRGHAIETGIFEERPS